MPTMSDQLRRRLAYAALTFAVATSAACDDTTEPEEDPEPEIVSVQVSTASSTVTVPVSGAQIGTLQLKLNLANTISVRYLNAAGQDEPVLVQHRSDYSLTGVMPTSMSFSPTGGTGATFTATITPTLGGAGGFQLILRNNEHGHDELTTTVAVNVVP